MFSPESILHALREKSKQVQAGRKTPFSETAVARSGPAVGPLPTGPGQVYLGLVVVPTVTLTETTAAWLAAPQEDPKGNARLRRFWPLKRRPNLGSTKAGCRGLNGLHPWVCHTHSVIFCNMFVHRVGLLGGISCFLDTLSGEAFIWSVVLQARKRRATTGTSLRM